MIIDYDHNPALTVDQKLQSLIENMQLMNDEIISELEELKEQLRKLQENN